MKRSELKIGQKVVVLPVHTNMDLPAPKPKVMYVRELKAGNTAGLSYHKTYDIIYKTPHHFDIKK